MKRSMQTTLGLLCMLSCGAFVLEACDHAESPAMTPSGTPLAPAAAASGARMGSTNAQPAGDEAPAYGPQSGMIPGGWGLPPDLTGLDDGQLVGLVQAIREADIEHLQLALTRSSSPEVLSFARDSIQLQRTGARQDDTDLTRLELTPTVSAASQKVLVDWQRDRSDLQALPLTDFDRSFIDHHVTRDTKAVALLDAAIDGARNPVLKAHLQSDRTTIAGHLREAEHVQMTLRSGCPTECGEDACVEAFRHAARRGPGERWRSGTSGAARGPRGRGP